MHTHILIKPRPIQFTAMIYRSSQIMNSDFVLDSAGLFLLRKGEDLSKINKYQLPFEKNSLFKQLLRLSLSSDELVEFSFQIYLVKFLRNLHFIEKKL